MVNDEPASNRRPAEPPMQAFDHVGMIRDLIMGAKHATLGTLDSAGGPFTSLVALARDEDLSPLIITSHLSGHTDHLEREPRVSLLIAAIGKGDPLAHPRLTLTGAALAARPGEAEYERIRPIYIAQNPKAQLYVQLPGFWFWRIQPDKVFLNGGFGKAWNGGWTELFGYGATG
jgi:putative heme iron utilization protein